MPKAEHAHTTSRRAVFALAGSTILAGAVAAPAMAASPDAELIRLCSRVVEIERFVDDYESALDIEDCPVLGPMVLEQDAIMGRLYGMEAQTAEGVRAKAAVVQTILADHEGRALYDHGRMALMVVGDAVRLVGRA